MKKNEIRVLILEILLIFVLFLALFALNNFARSILAIIIGIYAIIVTCILKKRKISSINKKQVTILMIIFAMLYLGIFYLLGLYFGFVKSKIVLSFSTLFKFIIPISIIVVASEVIREQFLSHKVVIRIKDNKKDISPLLTFISMVIVDLFIYTDIYNLTKLNDFLTLLGFVLFASLSCNLLYNYITIRYGNKGIIIYRLITILYIYFFPIVPDVYVFFRSFLRLLYPYIIYLVFEKLYSKNDYITLRHKKKKEIICNTILILIASLLVMLISCKFTYGIIVVGSESMMGTLNKGDAVIFEKYNNQEIEVGQVIIFDYNGIQTIHRVTDIRIVNGEYRYYTKGDANRRDDIDFRYNDDIYGLVKLRIKYIGYPTLWVRELFL